ncbi:DUF393 domain-containing protein [Nocardiopsis sp. EMB25]|uniref:thiol-disulfide oxidoreductase DCC family protein n=1 Tax=Nocardiopsis sp. EMB25 TaxID=2835867 RepID=UPI0022849276|nr:DUF393 domain-containing protein [Nocardiopsis sp. EMB25]MCY9786687.1 DUF393 domain-containing protein [Nocardiopsis sp. EMB25]
MSAERPLLVYDGDCGFCTRSVEATLGLPARFTARPWQVTDLVALGTTPERAAREVLWVAESGEIHGGADAFAELLRRCWGPWRGVGVVMALPGARSLARAVYRWIAAHRYRLPGSTSACRLPDTRR